MPSEEVSMIFCSVAVEEEAIAMVFRDGVDLVWVG
jgi:hypothetical protein